MKRGEVIYDPNQMKFEELNKILNNKSEDKLFNKRNLDNFNYKNIQTESSENIQHEEFSSENVIKSCMIPNTTKNKNSSKNIENFASISPINKNFQELKPNKVSLNHENKTSNQSQITSHNIFNNNNMNNIRKSQNDNYLFNENLKPILIIDVKLKEGIMKHIKVYEGDTADNLSNNFADENGIFIL